jgi:hypothetical protein
VYLFIATVLIFTYNFHDKFGDLAAAIMPPKQTADASSADASAASGTTTATAAAPAAPQGKASAALSGAQKNAAVRDALIDQLSSGNANK